MNFKRTFMSIIAISSLFFISACSGTDSSSADLTTEIDNAQTNDLKVLEDTEKDFSLSYKNLYGEDNSVEKIESISIICIEENAFINVNRNGYRGKIESSISRWQEKDSECSTLEK